MKTVIVTTGWMKMPQVIPPAGLKTNVDKILKSNLKNEMELQSGDITCVARR